MVGKTFLDLSARVFLKRSASESVGRGENTALTAEDGHCPPRWEPEENTKEKGWIHSLCMRWDLRLPVLRHRCFRFSSLCLGPGLKPLALWFSGWLTPLRTDSISSSGSYAFGLELNDTTGFPGSPAEHRRWWDSVLSWTNSCNKSLMDKSLYTSYVFCFSGNLNSASHTCSYLYVCRVDLRIILKFRWGSEKLGAAWGTSGPLRSHSQNTPHRPWNRFVSCCGNKPRLE